jgi:hypothetical protein
MGCHCGRAGTHQKSTPGKWHGVPFLCDATGRRFCRRSRMAAAPCGFKTIEGHIDEENAFGIRNFKTG